MSKNLQVLDDKLGISLNVKYEPLNKSEKDKQKVGFRNSSGKLVKLTTVNDQRQPVQTFKAYLDESGVEYAKADLVACDPDTGEELVEFEMTSVFHILKYEPQSNYVDRYIVDKFYELFPSDDGKTKDIDRKIAQDMNRVAMKKLYDHLVINNVVAKAEFVVTSGHYRAGAGYIRAITVDGGKWTLEIGAFKEEKVFKHLNEPKVTVDLDAINAASKKKKPTNSLL